MRRRTITLLAIAFAVAVIAMPTTAFAALKLPSGLTADRFAGGGAPVNASRAAVTRAAVPAGPTKSNLAFRSNILAWDLTPGDESEYTVGTDTYLDGMLSNPFVQSLKEVEVYVDYYDATDTYISTESFPARCDVVGGGDYALYALIIDKPAGTESYVVSADGIPCAAPGVFLSSTYKDSWKDTSDDTFHWVYTVTNNKPYSVNTIQPEGFEFNAKTDPSTGTTPLWSTAVFTDVMDDAYDSIPTTMTPGQSVDVELVGYNEDQSAEQRWASTRFEAMPYPLQYTTVFRFYNVKTGTHFYTGTVEERDSVIATLGWLYRYEGVAYTADTYGSSNLTPLYRFYNKKTGTHFYTADQNEKNNTLNNLGATYQLDGITYFVSNVPGGVTVYRFYNVKTGTHFYTADTTERDRVINTLGYLFRYEGPAYYVYGPTQ
jgi:hypothetical protein